MREPIKTKNPKNDQHEEGEAQMVEKQSPKSQGRVSDMYYREENRSEIDPNENPLIKKSPSQSE